MNTYNYSLYNHYLQDSKYWIQYFIEKGAADWNPGLYIACLHGHLKIVNLMIQKGADDWYFGLWGACEGGHLDLVNLMIEKGADDWDWGLFIACDSIHTYIMGLSAKDIDKDIKELQETCEYGHQILVDLMIEKAANNWEIKCTIGKYLDIINLMLQKGAKYWNQILQGSYLDAYFYSINYMIEKYENPLNKCKIPFKIPRNNQVIEIIYVSLYDYLPDEMIDIVLKYSIIEDFNLYEWLLCELER